MRSIIIFFSIILLFSTAIAKEDDSGFIAEEEVLEQPVLRLDVIKLKSEAIIINVKGPSFLKKKRINKYNIIKVGDAIEADDIIEIRKGSMVIIKSNKGDQIKLGNDIDKSRWITFEVN